jgi:hypothetical protein
MLGKVLQALYDHPTLRGADLQNGFKGTGVEITARLEPLSLEDLSHLYYALERSWQLSISYEVTVVYIESQFEPDEISPVLVPVPEYGVIVASEASVP